MSKLESAGKAYSACAKAVKSKSLTPAMPTAHESELLIGFGIASDWTRRAAALQPLTYNKRLMMRSAKTPAVTEMVRFSMAWSALNALFARPEIVNLFGGTSATSELSLLRYFIAHSGIPMAAISTHESNLRALLSVSVSSAVPGYALGTVLPSLQVLHEKFTPSAYRGRGVGKAIQDAISSNNYSTLDLASILYAMRNWSAHGALIGSSFRSVPRFKVFIGIIMEAISDIHSGVSSELLNKLQIT